MELPVDYEQLIKPQLGTEFDAFVKALKQPTPVSIRTNPFKKSALGWPHTEPIAWNTEGHYLPERPIFTLDPAFHAGAYYVQEASSMLVGWALEQLLDASQPINALDLCAAPGGKSTLLASLLSDESLLLCNEVIKSRVGILKENLQKWGCANVHISNHDPEDLSELTNFFDLILIDAPCSGEGLFRKDPAAMNEWSVSNVQLCAARQQRILAAALPLLKPNGILAYCTCTYNDTENQQNAAWILDNDFEEQRFQIPSDWGVMPKVHGYQCYPHRVRGEGFFFAVFKKNDADFETSSTLGRKIGFKSFKKLDDRQVKEVAKWLKRPEDFSFFVKPNQEIVALLNSQLCDLMTLDKALIAKGLGLLMGEFKGRDFVPSHALALSNEISTDIARIELLPNEALHYLKKESINIDAPKGWLLVCANGLPLGWAKGLGNRLNNYLPKDWRIRMDVE